MELVVESILFFILLGIGIGTLCSIVGLGGGILIIPASIFILGFDSKSAIFISLFSMMGLTISASTTYIRYNYVNYRLALLYNIWDTPGVILGGIIMLYASKNIMAGICGIAIITLSILLFRKSTSRYCTFRIHYLQETNNGSHGSSSSHNKEEQKNNVNKSKKNHSIFGLNIYIVSISSFSGGLITGFVGLGGGTTDTTSMLLLGVEPKIAAATSEFMMAFTALIGVITHVVLGTYNYSWWWPIYMSIGTIIGGQIGPFLSKKLKSSIVRKLLASLAAYTGFLMLLMIFSP